VAVGRPWRVGPAVGNGGGGFARRAITTSVVGAVLAIVAAAMTAIAVFVVVLGPVATDATIATMTAWKTAAWPLGMQHWCRASSRQPEARYCPCESPP
jgi:hypothetical protein